jgi:hypothetical protein
VGPISDLEVGAQKEVDLDNSVAIGSSSKSTSSSENKTIISFGVETLGGRGTKAI